MGKNRWTGVWFHPYWIIALGAAHLLLVWGGGRPAAWRQNVGLLTLARATHGQGWLGAVVEEQALTQATAWLEAALAIEQEALAAQRGLSLTHLLRGEPEAALAAWRRLPDMAAELAVWGEKARRAGDLARAEAGFGYASALKPTAGRYALWQGLAAEGQAKWATAAAVYQAALQQPGLAEVGRSVFYYRLGLIAQTWQTPPDPAAARTAYTLALQENAFDRPEQEAEVWYRLGELALADGEKAGAQAHFEQALGVSADHYWALYRLAQLAFENGDMARALAHTTAALRWWPEEPGRGWPYRLQGAIYAQAGDAERAYAAYTTALVYQPEDATLRALVESLRP